MLCCAAHHSMLLACKSHAWVGIQVFVCAHAAHAGSISQAASPRSSRREHAGTNAGGVLGELALALDATRWALRNGGWVRPFALSTTQQSMAGTL